MRHHATGGCQQTGCVDTRKRVDPVRRGRTILGASLLLTAVAAGTRAAAGFSYAPELESAIRADDGLDVTIALHTGLTYAWLVFAVLTAVAAVPLLVNGSGRTFAAGVCYALGMPLLLFSIGVIAPISTVRTLTWLTCGTVLLTGCFVMLTSGPVPRQRVAPDRRRPARSRHR
ncbi:hypothetical protein SAMN04488074_103503 [Lentzea albidocapillata subsp. violacea]|uniref:Uncharacterized protein n=1 Tax=Lentzea albidocapillata subsp. violacea TaxID=128104 RepID=A0A1G8XK80_9PSEU|nr:hypothetical protein SAMN04488074_103503 [Lentzea albidocapillata subsp. violacea]